MNRSWIWVAAGALGWSAVGAAVTLVVERRLARPPSLADLADSAERRLGELDLTAEQRQTLAAIREEWRRTVLTEDAAWHGRIAAAAAAADQRIVAMLTPEQAHAWRAAAIGADSNRPRHD